MINIEVHNQAVRAALDALAERVGKLQPLLIEVGAAIMARADARFTAQAGPGGQAWKPKKHKDGRPTLVGETGDLRRQIVMGVAGNRLEVSATAPYAAIHQFGGKIDRAAKQVTVRHRTDAKGELLRSEIIKNAAGQARGLIFARGGKDGHKRVLERTFEAKAHSITIPARPFMPVRADGSLYPAEQAEILAQINAWLAARPVA